ncbi:MAG: hypothetical protein KatS3mg057_1997 [Herpetosiphonaceae bacterium]|nr:MAG: hypothetical protein KatS3mg057_1997 [Herpetosiphonaceae bacterium]
MSTLIRPATAEDQQRIREIVRAARINPADLDWPRFLVAEDDGRIVGVGQVKPHRDGSRELASIAVVPERQGQGIGTAIIHELIARNPGKLYLMCVSHMEGYYQRFGFRRLRREEMPRYFRRMYWIAQIVARLTTRRRIQVLIMGRL